MQEAGLIHASIRSLLSERVNSSSTTNQINELITSTIKQKLPNQFNQGIAFPPSIGINDCVAHYCHYDDKPIGENKLVKIDFGVHIDGNIIDSALTINTSPENDMLNQMIECNVEALETGLKHCGNDAILGEIGYYIEEVINSFSYNEYEGKTIRELCGHKIEKWKIHGGKALPNFQLRHYRERMRNGEVYSIEPFLTTGTGGVIYDKAHTNLYNLNYNLNSVNHITQNKYLADIYKKYKYLPFLSTNIDKDFVKNNMINQHAPIYEHKDAFVSHFERTFYINERPILL